ncbi:hypothetical protein ACOSP7_022019 [Xanthoceras sorbifolium]
MAFVGLFKVFLAVICFFILHYFAKNNNKNGFPKNFPLVGMLPGLLLHVHRSHDFCTQILERSQCTFLLKGPWFASMDILLTTDSTNIHYIMSSNFPNFPKGPEFNQIFGVLGDGIFNSNSDSWKNQRKVALALINHQRFHQFLLKTSRNKVENGMIPILENVSKHGIYVDLQDLFQRFKFDSISSQFMYIEFWVLHTGYDPSCLSVEFPQVLFSRALEDVEKSIFYSHVVPKSLWKLQQWLGIGEEKKMKRAKKILDQTISEGEDLITSYMNEDKDKANGLRSNDQFLRDTVLNFMIAGRDTTGSAFTWFFWLVSKNPKWEFDLKELHKLAYLHGAICEALRLYPPLPFQHKASAKPDILPSGHWVVPSTKILFSLYALGRMKTCLGKEVAFTQIKIVAATILHNYNVVQVVEDDNTNGPNVSIILQMKHGLTVRVFKRWDD